MNSRALVFRLAAITSISICVFFSIKLNRLHGLTRKPKKTEGIASIPHLVPIAVIGSGPAGLSAALFTARENFHTVVFQGPNPGGVLKDTGVVENWPGILQQPGAEIMSTLEQQVKNFGGIIVPETIERVDFAIWPFRLYTSSGKEINALSVIIATGTQPRKLNIPGEQTYWGKGVSGCTHCDAPLTKDQDVVVIGGGDTAVQHALHVLPHAKSITISVHNDALNAESRLIRKLKEHPEIKILYNQKALQMTGNNEKLDGIELMDIKTGKAEKIPAHWVFLAIGYDANSSIFSDALDRDSKGIIKVAPYTQATSKPGIFAAGKVANARYKLGAIASGEGIKAGLDAISFLEKKGYDLDKITPLKPNFFNPNQSAPQKTNITQQQEMLPSIKDSQELSAYLNSQSKPSVIEFFSPRCPHCKTMQPIVQELASELKIARIGQVDVSQAPAMAKEYNIRGVPSFIIFIDGKEKARKDGSMSKKELISFIEQSIQ